MTFDCSSSCSLLFYYFYIDYLGYLSSFYAIYVYSCANFGKMTLTFRMVVSKSFESVFKNCCRVFSFEIIMFGHSFHRITTKNHDIMVDTIYSKAVTFDH